jgi:integrase
MVRPSGAKVWIYRYRDPAGRMAQLLLGSYPALSLADVRTEWRNAKAIRDKHGDPRDEAKRRKEVAAERAVRSRGYTVKQAAEDYNWEHLSKLARGAERWRILERNILPGISNVVLAELKPSQVMDVITPIRKRAPRVASMAVSAIRGFIAHAKKMHRLSLDVPSPAADIPAIPQGKRKRALSSAEIVLLLRWLDSGAVSQNIADILRLTLYTGARTGEVCAMRSRDVDITSRTWTHTQTKTGDVSITPLSRPAVEILRDRRGGEYVFDIRGNPIKQKALTVALFMARQAGADCPIDAWTPHDLRRTVRTGLARLGCPFEVGESILGHRLPGVSGTYNVYEYADEMRRWLDQWAQNVGTLAAGKVIPMRAKRKK